jgi:preprotein translocase subunit SecF
MPNIIGRRYLWFFISLLVIVPGTISLLFNGLRVSIDFTGGTLWEIGRLQHPGTLSDVRSLFAKQGITELAVQTSDKGEERGFLIRTRALSQEERQALLAAMREQFGDFVEMRFESVGPIIGQEVTQRAQIAVAAASLGILLYITLAFRGIPHSFRMGVCAIIALLHDVLVVVGLFSILGVLFGVEVDALFLTALLTIIGFSVHDTIVVFDRIRENRRKYPNEDFERVVNFSVFQTLDRSINTTLTVLFTLTALLLFGGVTIRTFVLALLIGITSGTYSSIFNASPLLVVWEYNEIGQFFARLRGRQPQAA